jgi:hypothetical protein
MTITIKCPNCERALNVPDEAPGKLARCPACGETFAIGKTAEPTPAPVTTPQSSAVQNPPAWDAETPLERRREEEEDEAEERRRRRDDEEHEDERYRDIDGGYRYPHRGPTILTLGILSLCFACAPLLSWILGGIAISMANNDLTQMGRRKMDPGGRSITQTGRTLATVGVILTTIWFVLACVLMRLPRFR